MTIFILINVILVLYSLFHFIRYFIFIKQIKKKNNLIKNKKDFNLVIVIPCFQEQNTIEKTILYFKSIINEDTPLVLVTTNKEKDYPSTKDIIEEKIINHYSNVFLHHYNKDVGMMADQLNDVLVDIKTYLPPDYNSEKTYFCVYNADSCPDKNTFTELASTILENHYPGLIQQYSYAFSNFNRLSPILKGFAIYQSNFELKMGLLNAYFDSFFLHRHLVGHGLFIRLDLLNKIHGFNTEYWCEDIYMTAIINNLNLKITPMLSLEVMETPNRLEKLIKQNSVWFATSFQNFKIYKEVFRNQKHMSLRGFFGFISELRSTINWLCFSLIIILQFIISIKLGIFFFILSLFTYSLYILSYSITTILLINILNKNKVKYTFPLFLDTFFATLISNIGPLYYLIFRPKEKYKTER